MTTRINILPEELTLAASVLSLPNFFDIKYSAPVRLYKSTSNNHWNYANSCGILTVTLVEKQTVVMIRLVDLKTKSVTMEQECYEGFEYLSLSSNFHAFESDDGFVGLLFAERFDADQFAKQVCQLIRLKATGSINGTPSQPSIPSTHKPSINMRSDSSDTSPTINAPPTPVKRTNPQPTTPPPVTAKPTSVNSSNSIAASSSINTHSHVTQTKEPEKKHTTSNSGGNSGGSSSGGLFSKIFGTKNKEQVDRSQIKISGPKVDRFKHVSHIGFDPKQGFTEIPPELKSIFEKAGISEEQLKDKKTAKFLMKTLVTVTSEAPPPPPSLDTPPVPGRPQPPQPGTRSTPPPPPFKGGGSNVPSGSSAIGVGGFVPPPPTNVPPPPSVDHSIKPRVSVASPATDSDGASGGGIDMLSEIKNKKLRNVKQEDLPEFNHMAESDQNNLAAKIAGIMELRRGNIEYSSDEESDDDDWEL